MKRITVLFSGLILAALTAAIATGTGAAAGGLPTLTIAMNGKSITVAGTLRSGAVNVVSTTSKERQGAPFLVRLKPGASFAKGFAAVAAHHGDPNYLSPYGSIVFDATAVKGISSVQTALPPGTYVALDAAGNNPAKWPRTTFTITPAGHPASLPAPGARVRSIEFAFRGASTLHRGQLVRFQNDGFLVHMVDAVAVKDTRSAKRVTALLRAGKDKQAQRLAVGFVSFAGPQSPGAVQQLVVTAKPGIYVLVCFMDTQDGREHTRLGMVRTIRIVK